MTIDREMLAAYAENQLDEADRKRVEAAIAADAALAQDVARHRALRDQLQAHFAPIAAMPVPDRLIAAVRNPALAAEPIDLNAARAARLDKTLRPVRTRWFTGGAIAASLAIGLILGSQIAGNGLVGSVDGRLVAQGALDTALTTQLASADKQPVHIVLSLRTTEERYCRVFQTDTMAGLACRSDGRWDIERLDSGDPATGGPYRQAGNPLGEIMAAAQNRASSGAMNASEEQAAIAKGWE